MHSGLLSAALAYVIWGLFPLYFHQLRDVNALEVVLHRSLWSLLFMLALLALKHRWQALTQALRQPRTLAVFAASALLLSGNWLIYVWAVHSHRVIEASLGYFINPLFNVLLGVLVLHERPRPVQWLALGLAALGVVGMAWVSGAAPWVSLALALTFGLYGLLKKLAPLGAQDGLALETLILAPLVIPALAWFASYGGDTAHATPATWLWLLAAGPLTAVPLLLFAYGAQRITLSTLGLLQYLGPTLQFAIGLWVFHEPMQPARLAGFGVIWLALLVYSGESLWFAARRSGTTAAP
ncbi:membrane protein [Vitreoscilla filiformis]|uniref:Membrane protein n=1 Tax=Vitreoscilla filiformis TaxID=63 RepID=A0A221KIW9_VITFI|nr:EamA family transporter RarD [Vitreoscilla filiformis]ASM78773.1 membrane protein [Vitreoscilla filiformis]